MTTVTIDEAKLGTFMEHVLGDAAGLMSTTLATAADINELELQGPLNSLYVVKP